MKLFNMMKLLALAACTLVSSGLMAHDSFHKGTRERDFDAVQRFVNSKRTISLEEKDSNLSIAGDIRVDWTHTNESVAKQKLRNADDGAREVEDDDLFGGTYVVVSDVASDGVEYKNNEFDIEFNLYIDYICDRSWGVVWLQFHDDAGIDNNIHRYRSQDVNGLYGSGNCDGLCLKKAYIGYNICADGCQRIDIEIGRRPLYTIFDSRVQFNSRFDGILLKYSRPVENWGDFYWNIGGFVVDDRSQHYAYATELGLVNICDCGLSVKYSFIDWLSGLDNSYNRARGMSGNIKKPYGTRFRISQISGSYTFQPECLCMPLKVYAAYLHNHDATAFSSGTGPTAVSTNGRKLNDAWYAGAIIGKVCHECDWSFEVNFQKVEAQALPDEDVSGIGFKRNVLLETFTAEGRGFTNYMGWFAEGLYAVTDNLTVNARFEYSQEADKDVVAVAFPTGTDSDFVQPSVSDRAKHKYTMLRVQAIYAF